MKSIIFSVLALVLLFSLVCSTTIFTGKHRRILRCIASKLKQSGEMKIVQLASMKEKNDLPENLFSESFLQNLESNLIAHEFVQVLHRF
jgi:hypothetical protein